MKSTLKSTVKPILTTILLILGTLGPVSAAPAPAAKLTLNRSYGGAVISGNVFVPRNDELTGAWSGVGFARLLKCSPLCKVVSSISLKNTTTFSSGSTYRIALGGQFVPGQKVKVMLRFKGSGLLVTQAVVNR